MSNSRRRFVFAYVYGCLLGGLPIALGGCGGGDSADGTAVKLDPAREKALADERKATEEFYATRKGQKK